MGTEPVLVSVAGSTRLRQPHQLCLLPLYVDVHRWLGTHTHTHTPSPLPLFTHDTHTLSLSQPLSVIEAQAASPLFAHRK